MLSRRIADLVMDVNKAKQALNKALLKETKGEISLCAVDTVPQLYVEVDNLSFEDFCRKYAPLQCHACTSTNYHCTAILPNGVKATVLLPNDSSLEVDEDMED